MSREILRRCPACGAALVRRTNRDNGSVFLGCRQWPYCSYTEEIPEYVKLIEQGAEMLPGFGN